jgi:hypothetical protein
MRLNLQEVLQEVLEHCQVAYRVLVVGTTR